MYRVLSLSLFIIFGYSAAVHAGPPTCDGCKRYMGITLELAEKYECEAACNLVPGEMKIACILYCAEYLKVVATKPSWEVKNRSKEECASKTCIRGLICPAN